MTMEEDKEDVANDPQEPQDADDDDEDAVQVSGLQKRSKKQAMRLLDSDSEDDATPRGALVSATEKDSDRSNPDEEKDEELGEEPPRDTRIESKKSTISDLYDSESSDDNDESTSEPNGVQHEYSECNGAEEPSKPVGGGRQKDSQKMSAKQAMEQLQKIKSESARMLREKRFHLPYHKPKQVTLKQIMDKKKIQFVPGQKKVNIRMSQAELEEYAKKLDEKEKDVIEMCKSDEEEGNDIDSPSTNTTDITKPDTQLESINHSNSLNQIHSEILPSKPNEASPLETNEAIPIEINKVLPDETNEDIPVETNEVLPVKTDQNAVAIVTDSQETSISDNGTVENCTESLKIYFESEPPRANLTADDGQIPGTSKEPEIDDEAAEARSRELDEEIESYEPSTLPDNNAAEKMEFITSSLPAKPVLAGCPGSFIDLTDEPQELTGVDLLKQKYLFHSKIKTKEELEFEKEKHQLPGTALMNFKRELEREIQKRRLEEWNKKKIEESATKKEDDEVDDELSECEKMLEDEVTDKETVLNINEEDNELEDDENDGAEEEDDDDEEEEETELVEKERPKCDLIDDEAESDDGDDGSSTDSSTDSEKEDESKEKAKNRVSRLLKVFDDSDSSEDETPKPGLKETTVDVDKEVDKESDVMATPVRSTLESKDSKDIFESQDVKKSSESFAVESDDFLPLGQQYPLNITTPVSDNNIISRTESIEETVGRPDLASLISPMIKNTSPKNNISSIGDEPGTPKKAEKLMNLQKKLFMESETQDNIEDSQALVNLCSGKFPSQTNTSESGLSSLSVPTVVPKFQSDTEMSQSTESELLELCSGKFATESQTVHNGESSDRINVAEGKPNDIAKVINPLVGKPKNTIQSFFAPAKKNEPVKTNVATNKEDTEKIKESEEIKAEPSRTTTRKLVIASSDEENVDNIASGKVKKLKSKKNRKRAKPLQLSDDESDEDYPSSEAEENDLDIPAKENGDEFADQEVAYDSEENEIPVDEVHEVLKDKAKKKTSEFFDNEAELTSEDEWKGSGDEDERGLDRLEWEEGDADQIDERKVTKELERIHRHQMLDKDMREVKILQDILLEDGDLEGGTRERKFKWKNLDSGIESGAIVGDDNPEETAEDLQNEEQWRKQRHERETFLREQMEKEAALEKTTVTETVFKLSSRVSFVAPLTPNVSSKEVVNKIQVLKMSSKSCDISKNPSDESAKKAKDLPSPVKKPFAILKGSFKGFLSRGEASLNRLASLVGAPQKDGEAPKNLSGIGKKGNFVFTTISPPCNNKMDEETKKVKRKNLENASTPVLMKKMKMSEANERKFKKSLFDHVD